MGIRITVLCENSVGDRRGLGEHGFSALIETSGGHYLFDTGGGHTILPNIRASFEYLLDKNPTFQSPVKKVLNIIEV